MTSSTTASPHTPIPSPPFRVLITDRAWPDTAIEQAALAAIGGEVFEPPNTDEATLVRSAADADAIATNWAKVSEAVVRAAVKCRTIARFGVGVDNIAIPSATERGIPVTNCPDYCVAEVSDHTLGLLLACARGLGIHHLRTKRGDYEPSAAPTPQRLSTQTLGLIGLGRIGREVCHKARAFGLKVIAHTRTGHDQGLGCPMLPLHDVLAQSDYLSLHAPLTPETRHIVGRDEFQLLKPSCYLINTSRGGLIDHAALWEALQANRIAGAALDVFDPEPPDLSQPLFQDERVLLTPHTAFISQQSVEQMRRQVMEQVAAVLTGQRPHNLLNPQVYASPA